MMIRTIVFTLNMADYIHLGKQILCNYCLQNVIMDTIQTAACNVHCTTNQRKMITSHRKLVCWAIIVGHKAVIGLNGVPRDVYLGMCT